MADGTNRGGGNKPFPKTFGDVMRGIPAGGERRERSGGSASGDRPRGPRREQKPAGEPGPEAAARRGPVVVRKPALGGALSSGAATPEATDAAGGATPGASAPRGTAFRRSEARSTQAPVAPSTFELPPEEEPAPGESFAELFAVSERTHVHRRFEIGQKVSGQIVKVGKELAFLDLGGKGEATIALAELLDENGQLAVPPSGMVEGFILSLTNGIVVTKALTQGAQRDFLDEAYSGGIPVEGTVTGHNKGGLEIDLGGVRGFCPVSQIANHFVENPAELVGQKFSFRITELKEGDVVLSRRALMEAEAAAKAAVLRERLAVGVRLEGRVTSLREFGAFVDLGGLEGLLHVSELGHSRIGDPKELLEVGQSVVVEVIRIDPPKAGEQREKIALSMKAMQEDPWIAAVATLREGERRTGRVVRLQPFGAFIELMPGVDGLAHISALGASKRIAHPRDVVNEGDEVTVVIESIEPAQKRISLRRLSPEELASPESFGVETREGEEPSVAGVNLPASAKATPAPLPKVGAVVEATVDRIEPFGLFVAFGGHRGLIPNVEMGTPRGTDHRKLFPVGTTFKAAVIEIDPQGRLRLSKTAAEKAEERAEYDQFLSKEKSRSGGGKGFGTFADLLKAKK